MSEKTICYLSNLPYVIIGCLLLYATGDRSSIFYIVLRFIIYFTSFLMWYLAVNKELVTGNLTFCIINLVVNIAISVVYYSSDLFQFSKGTWCIIDIVCAIVLFLLTIVNCISIKVLRK